MDATEALHVTDAPEEASTRELDVRSMGPPKPMTETLETLAQIDDGEVLVQYNDRAPEFLYPKLEDRGFTYDTVENDEVTVTTIWKV